jgi:predicted RNA-binding Zn-ribbon protein involved in translation (DUF1610 family)
MSHISLPEIPAPRLIREAVNSYQLYAGTNVDWRSEPWESLREIVINFVRHRLTNYDARRLAGEDRDELRQQIRIATLRRYSWLACDPRPFPREKPRAFLNSAAAALTEWRQYEYSLIELLPRIGDPQEKAKIHKQLSVARTIIAKFANLLLKPRVTETGSLPTFGPTPTGEEYDWCGFELYPNSLEYCGFKCPRCGVAVYRTKQARSIGQGKRATLHSCHCLHQFELVGPHKLEPMRVDEWQHYLDSLTKGHQ